MEKGKRNYLHSALGYRTPIQVEEEYYKNKTSHKNAAWLFGWSKTPIYLICSEPIQNIDKS